MGLHLPTNSIGKLLTLCAYAICVAVVLGAGGLLQPQRPQLPIPGGSPAAIEAPIAELPLEQIPTDPPVFFAETLAASQQIGMPVASLPTPNSAVGPGPQQEASFLGVWAPDASSCSMQNFRDGWLPTVINLDGAVAGDTFCSFKNPQQTQNAWRVDAVCSNKREQWSTRVHLVVNGDRLMWKSKRGSQVYTRCTQGMRIAMH